MVTLAYAVVAYLRALLLTRHRLALEAVVLRQQLAVFKRNPKLDRLDRLFWMVAEKTGMGFELPGLHVEEKLAQTTRNAQLAQLIEFRKVG